MLGHCEFFKSAKVSKPKNLFLNKRVSAFVLIPTLPRNLTEEEYRIQPTASRMSVDDENLVAQGEATIKLLKNHLETPVCPYIIFFDFLNEIDEKYADHSLSLYVKMIIKEKQHPLEFHIASHGDPSRIGPYNLDSGLAIEDFADKLKIFFVKHQLLELMPNFLDSKIFFTFHTCNSALCDITASMTEKERDELIHSQTLIGRFWKRMKELGFTHLTVTGFRGYYCPMSSAQGAVVTPIFHHPKPTSIHADKVKFTILPKGTISIPQNPYFYVQFLGSAQYRPR